MSEENSVLCRNLGKTWNAGTIRAHEALRNIDLAVKPGEFVVLLGPSGCGKSSLLYLVAGLEEHTSGTLDAFGAPVTGPSPDRSLIFQQTSLFPWLTVWQNVTFGLSLRGEGAEARRAAAREALARVGLSDAMEKRPDELSAACGSASPSPVR